MRDLTKFLVPEDEPPTRDLSRFLVPETPLESRQPDQTLGTSMVRSFTQSPFLKPAISTMKWTGGVSKKLADVMWPGQKQPIESFPTYKWGENLEKFFEKHAPIRNQEKWPVQVAGTAGHMLGLAATTAVGMPPVASVPTGMVRTAEISMVAPKLAAMLFGGFSQAGQSYDEALQKTGDPDISFMSGLHGWASGSSEIVVSNAIGRIAQAGIPNGIASKVGQRLIDRGLKGIGQAILRGSAKGLIGGSEEFFQEGLQALYEGMSAKQLYDESREIKGDVLKNATMGFFIGFVLSSIGVGIALKRRSPGVSTADQQLLQEAQTNVEQAQIKVSEDLAQRFEGTTPEYWQEKMKEPEATEISESDATQLARQKVVDDIANENYEHDIDKQVDKVKQGKEVSLETIRRAEENAEVIKQHLKDQAQGITGQAQAVEQQEYDTQTTERTAEYKAQVEDGTYEPTTKTAQEIVDKLKTNQEQEPVIAEFEPSIAALEESTVEVEQPVTTQEQPPLESREEVVTQPPTEEVPQPDVTTLTGTQEFIPAEIQHLEFKKHPASEYLSASALDERFWDWYNRAGGKTGALAQGISVQKNNAGVWYARTTKKATELEQATEAMAEKEPWETSDLVLQPNIPIGYVEAKKQDDGKWKLFFRGATDEVFQGETFNSANEARNFFKVQQIKAQEASQSSAEGLPTKPTQEVAPRPPQEATGGTTESIATEYAKTMSLPEFQDYYETQHLVGSGAEMDALTRSLGLYEGDPSKRIPPEQWKDLSERMYGLLREAETRIAVRETTESTETPFVYGSEQTGKHKSNRIDADVNAGVLNTIDEARLKHYNLGGKAISQGTGAERSERTTMPDDLGFVIAKRKPPKYQGHVIYGVDGGQFTIDKPLHIPPSSSDYAERTVAIVKNTGEVQAVTIGSRTSAGGMIAIGQLNATGESPITHGLNFGNLNDIKAIYVLDLDKAYNSSLYVYKPEQFTPEMEEELAESDRSVTEQPMQEPEPTPELTVDSIEVTEPTAPTSLTQWKPEAIEAINEELSTIEGFTGLISEAEALGIKGAALKDWRAGYKGLNVGMPDLLIQARKFALARMYKKVGRIQDAQNIAGQYYDNWTKGIKAPTILTDAEKTKLRESIQEDIKKKVNAEFPKPKPPPGLTKTQEKQVAKELRVGVTDVLRRMGRNADGSIKAKRSKGQDGRYYHIQGNMIRFKDPADKEWVGSLELTDEQMEDTVNVFTGIGEIAGIQNLDKFIQRTKSAYAITHGISMADMDAVADVTQQRNVDFDERALRQGLASMLLKGGVEGNQRLVQLGMLIESGMDLNKVAKKLGRYAKTPKPGQSIAQTLGGIVDKKMVSMLTVLQKKAGKPGEDFGNRLVEGLQERSLIDNKYKKRFRDGVYMPLRQFYDPQVKGIPGRRVQKVNQRVRDSMRRIERWFDDMQDRGNTKVVLNQAEETARSNLQALKDDMWKDDYKAGVISKDEYENRYIEHYLPKQWDISETEAENKKFEAIQKIAQAKGIDETQAEKLWNRFIKSKRDRVAYSLEEERLLDDAEGGIRGLEERMYRYIEESARRQSEVKTFGKGDEKLNALIARMKANDATHGSFAESIRDIALGLDAKSADEKHESRQIAQLRGGIAASLLQWSWVQNMTEPALLTFRTSFRDTLKASKKTLVDAKLAQEFAEDAAAIPVTNAKSTIGRILSKSEADYITQIEGYDTGEGRFSRYREFMFRLQLFTPSERYIKILEANGAVEYANRMLQRLAKGKPNNWAKKRLAELVNTLDGNEADALIQAAGKDTKVTLDKLAQSKNLKVAQLANDAMFRAGVRVIDELSMGPSGIMRRPMDWVKGPNGRLIFQFKSWSFQVTRMVKEELRRGGVRAWLKLLGVFYPVSVVATLAERLAGRILFGKDLPEDETEWMWNMIAAPFNFGLGGIYYRGLHTAATRPWALAEILVPPAIAVPLRIGGTLIGEDIPAWMKGKAQFHTGPELLRLVPVVGRPAAGYLGRARREKTERKGKL